MVDSDNNSILLDNSQHSNPKCPFRLKKSYSVALKPEHSVNQERPRSNSHISFNYRPEFVPKPKPKPTNVNPSPMQLCRRITSFSSNSRIEFDCISSDSLSYSEETQPFSPIEDDSSEVNDLRKEMKKSKKSIWKKHIQKQEEKNWLYHSCDNSGRKTMSSHSNLSILGILESAASEKVNLRQSSLY